MKMNCRFAIGAVLASILVFCCCSKSEKVISGNGSETENAFTGKIVYQDGTPAAGVAVRIMPVSNVPSFSSSRIKEGVTRTTDENGRYSLDGVDSGVYNVEGLKESLGVFIDSILTDGGHDIPEGILKKCGSVTGIIHMEGQTDTNQIRATLYMPGTRRITKPLIGGKFLFDYMPEGKYQLNIDPLPQYGVKIIDLQVTAGQILDLDTMKFHVTQPEVLAIDLRLGCTLASLENQQVWFSGVRLLDGSMGGPTPGYGIDAWGTTITPGKWALLINKSNFPVLVSVYYYNSMIPGAKKGPISDSLGIGDSVFIYRVVQNYITVCIDGNHAVSNINTLRPQDDGRTYFNIWQVGTADTTQDCAPAQSSNVLDLSKQ